MSALDLAKQQNHPQVCEILEKHGAKETGPGSQVVMECVLLGVYVTGGQYCMHCAEKTSTAQ